MSNTTRCIVASDTGPLISLEKLQTGYWLLKQLYTSLLIPPIVMQELMAGTDHTPEHYCKHYQITDFLTIIEPTTTFQHTDNITLHEGEIQAIALALEHQCPLLIEEHAGRTVAASLNIKLSGIAGQILKCYRCNIIAAETAETEWLNLRRSGRIGKNLHQSLQNLL